LNALNLYSLVEQDLDFSEEIAELYNAYELFINQIEPSSLIDIGCGQGDFLLQVKNEDMKTFGIDLSDEQIKICQEKGIDSACIDIADVKEKYDCATAMFDVLNYINQNELKNFIQNTYNVLNNDSYFIFDVNTLFGFEEVAQGSLNINKQDKFIGIDAYFEDEKLSTNITLFQKEQNDLYKKYNETITQYYHSKEYLEDILKDIGFEVQNALEFKLHDENNADKYIFLCKK
jgi:cyclopropane fatty-acyl-phospholipid synthase-like methyltransferase